MKAEVLLENTACSPELHAAHGLSLYLSTPMHRILFDMGPGNEFADNARTMGVELASVDLAVLSHGHSDHCGGLQTFLERNASAVVYLQQEAFGAYYSSNGTQREYIGMDPALRDFETRFRYTQGVRRIDSELTLFDSEADAFGAMSASASLWEKLPDGDFRPDAFRHEQNLLITAEGKAVLVAGCAHRGIVNIRARAEELLGQELDAVIAGFHLFQLPADDPASDALIVRTGEALARGKTVYYTGHCTGRYAFGKLREILGERLRPISGGAVLTL